MYNIKDKPLAIKELLREHRVSQSLAAKALNMSSKNLGFLLNGRNGKKVRNFTELEVRTIEELVSDKIGRKVSIGESIAIVSNPTPINTVLWDQIAKKMEIDQSIIIGLIKNKMPIPLQNQLQGYYEIIKELSAEAANRDKEQMNGVDTHTIIEEINVIQKEVESQNVFISAYYT